MALDYLTAALLVLTAIAAVSDSCCGLIPNWLTLPALAIAPLLQLALGGGGALTRSLLGIAVCAAIPLCLFRAGAMGGGDVKLLGAIGALAGPLDGLELQLLAYNVLVLFACIVLACQRRLLAVLRRSWRLLGMRRARSGDAQGVEPLDPAATFRLGLPIFVSAITQLALEVAR